MKKIKLTLLFIAFTALFYSCEKDDFNEIENTPISQISLSKNPYSLDNMKIAYQYLIEQGRLDPKMFRDFKVRATHNYVKLRPATLEEEDLIAADTTFIAFDYPLDVDLPESYFEERKELEEGKIPEYYSSLKLNQKIAYTGSIEQIEEMYVPEEDPYFEDTDEDYKAGSKTITTRAQLHDELLFTAYFLQGLEYLINEDEFAAKGINLEDNKPQKPSITNLDNSIVIDDASQKRFNDNIIKPLFIGKRWNASGTLRYTDTSFPAGNQTRPLPGAQVLLRQGVTVRTAITDSNGYFRTGRLRGRARYIIQWERAKYNIKGHKGWQAEQRGPRQRSSWNWTIEPNHNDQADIYYALIHLACLDYYYGDRFGLTQPRHNIRIRGRKTTKCTSSHVTLRKNFGGSDIVLCKFRENHSAIYGTTIHELAHSAHYQFNRPGYNKLVRDGHINPWISMGGQTFDNPGPTAKSARRTLETWATTVELLFVQRRYNLSPNIFSDNNLNGDYRQLMQNQNISIGFPIMNTYYTSCGFDLIDNHNQRTDAFLNRPIDRVTGYTPRQLEMSLYGATNWNKWRDNIKSQHNNNTSQFVDELFGNWN